MPKLGHDDSSPSPQRGEGRGEGVPAFIENLGTPSPDALRASTSPRRGEVKKKLRPAITKNWERFACHI
jgi:hypothetical protein